MHPASACGSQAVHCVALINTRNEIVKRGLCPLSLKLRWPNNNRVAEQQQQPADGRIEAERAVCLEREEGREGA